MWLELTGYKSIRYDYDDPTLIKIKGTKKRVFFDYDMEEFFNDSDRCSAGSL